MREKTGQEMAIFHLFSQKLFGLHCIDSSHEKLTEYVRVIEMRIWMRISNKESSAFKNAFIFFDDYINHYFIS